jgi:Rod binding domain-containing protein
MHVDGAAAMPNQSVNLPQSRLVEAAHEFEAQMMKELLKPLTGGTTMDGNESDSGSGLALGDFATDALGQSLSRSGGLGIATSILRSLSPHDTTSQPSPSPGDLARKDTDELK